VKAGGSPAGSWTRRLTTAMHEPTDLARLAAGVPVAILLPLCLPRLRQSPYLQALVAAGLAALVAAPLLPDAAAWMALAGSPTTVLATAKLRPAPPNEDSLNTPRLREGLALLLPALTLTVASLVLLKASEVWAAIETVIDSNGVIVVSSGALAAVFLGGEIVAWVLSPFAAALAKKEDGVKASSLAHAGTLIGWFERALFFAFIVGGQPQAAAVALAAKSFARFPSLSEHREGFAEYFLIGTLGSLVIALAAAIAVRAALGLGAF
jgi:hypothetical protein